MTYDQARAAAQRRANAEHADMGVWCDYFGEWHFRRLPLPQNRYGHELTCEVVRPE